LEIFNCFCKFQRLYGGIPGSIFAWPMIPHAERSVFWRTGGVMLSNSNVTSARHYHWVHVYAFCDYVLCVCSQRTPDTFEHASRVCSFCSIIIHAWCSYCTPLALRLPLTLWVFIMHRHRRPFAVIARDFDDRPLRHLECSWQIWRLLRFRSYQHVRMIYIQRYKMSLQDVSFMINFN